MNKGAQESQQLPRHCDNGKLSKAKAGTKAAHTLMGKLAGLPRCWSVYVAPADLQMTQIKRAMDISNGLPQHRGLRKLVSLESLGLGKKCEKRKDCWYYRLGCWGNRKGNSNELMELIATRNNQDKYCWVNRASNTMEAWLWSWPVASRLKHVHVKTWTAGEGNAEGQPCKVPDAFNRSHPVAQIPSYMLEDARERDVE